MPLSLLKSGIKFEVFVTVPWHIRRMEQVASIYGGQLHIYLISSHAESEMGGPLA
jgi:hypothetical protein